MAKIASKIVFFKMLKILVAGGFTSEDKIMIGIWLGLLGLSLLAYGLVVLLNRFALLISGLQVAGLIFANIGASFAANVAASAYGSSLLAVSLAA